MNWSNSWWKILGVLLILYSLVAGLTIPLGPGILSVSPYNVQSGSEVRLEVEGYNTSFGDDVRFWLKLDSLYSIQATEFKIHSDNEASAVFSIPSDIPHSASNDLLTLIVDDPSVGTAILPGAVHLVVSGVKDTSLSSEAMWLKNGIGDLTIRKGFLFPYRSILEETIRNTFFHVAFWMAMFVILTLSCVFSILFLINKDLKMDARAYALAEVGLLYGIIGLVTGMVWANYTWGAMWSGDIKQNMTAVALMIYASYFVLRRSVSDDFQKARFTAIYNIFAFLSLFPLLFIIPRMVDSLHPGSGGNPAMGGEDLDSMLRLVFYPAILGWILFGCWLASINARIQQTLNG